MRSSHEARANGRPWVRSQSMISFLSPNPCAAIAAIHSARSRPVRALSPARNSRSSSCSFGRPSLAMVPPKQQASEPASRARLVVAIRLPEALFEMPLLRQDGKPENREREHRRQNDIPDVMGQLGEAQENEHVAHVDRIAPPTKRAV